MEIINLWTGCFKVAKVFLVLYDSGPSIITFNFELSRLRHSQQSAQAVPLANLFGGCILFLRNYNNIPIFEIRSWFQPSLSFFVPLALKSSSLRKRIHVAFFWNTPGSGKITLLYVGMSWLDWLPNWPLRENIKDILHCFCLPDSFHSCDWPSERWTYIHTNHTQSICLKYLCNTALDYQQCYQGALAEW